MMACGRLKVARQWLFEIRGWKELPRTFRGEQILKWGADHAWLAAKKDWKRNRSVRNWCRSVAPSLTDAELDQLVAYSADSNKGWTHDQSATVLEITLHDSQEHGFGRFVGASDDPNYEIRNGLKLEKAAARARKYRAAHSTGAKRGRPALQLSEEERLARRTAQATARKRAERERKKAAKGVTLNCVTPLNLQDIGSVTHFSVTGPSHEFPIASEPGAPATREPAPVRVVLESEILDDLDDDGVAFGAPPPTHLERTLIPF